MKLVIFDYDGVLMDTFTSTVKIYLDISREFNLNLPDQPDFYKELFELDWRETMKKLNIVSKWDLEKQERIFIAGLKKYGELIKPYEGIQELLQTLSKKYILAIATNNFRHEIDYRLKKYDMHRYFSGFFTCEDGEMKPHPDLINKCMKKFNIDPKDTVFIGDMDGDIESGRAANVGRMIAVTYGYHLKHRLQDADLLVGSTTELLKALQ